MKIAALHESEDSLLSIVDFDSTESTAQLEGGFELRFQLADQLS